VVKGTVKNYPNSRRQDDQDQRSVEDEIDDLVGTRTKDLRHGVALAVRPNPAHSLRVSRPRSSLETIEFLDGL
jgi:hypothetical protein